MPSELARHWTLDPSTVFLNHGSFGATPRSVLEAQSAFRERMESEPVRFFVRELEPALDEARLALGEFLGADPEGIALVPNATAGINIVARSVDLEPGDEILVLDHAYNAARNALADAAERCGARVVVAELPFPGATPEAAVEAVMRCVSPRTRLAIVDHVTSATALVLPVTAIVAALSERGIDTLVDGAHAPGMLDVGVGAIGATYYAGTCHKWLYAPKGSGFLHVRADRRERVRPLAISHGANSPRRDRSRFRLEHDWTGTNDPTALLSIPAAISFGASLLPSGWEELRRRDDELTVIGRDAACAALGVERPAPDEMLGSMAAIPLPGVDDSEPPLDVYADPVHAAFQRHGIQVAISPWPPQPAGRPWRRLLRFSVAPYVSREDLDRLVQALPEAVDRARVG
jgi:isopenicillin-N epimerase